MPLFSDWRDFYDRCFGPYVRRFSIKDAESDLVTVEGFRAYILGCIDPKMYPDLRILLDTVEIGYNDKTKRLGKLLSEWTFDFFASVEEDGEDGAVDLGSGI